MSIYTKEEGFSKVGSSWFSAGCRLNVDGRMAFRIAASDPLLDATRAVAKRDFRLLDVYSTDGFPVTARKKFNPIKCSIKIPGATAPGSFSFENMTGYQNFLHAVRVCYADAYNLKVFRSDGFPFKDSCVVTKPYHCKIWRQIPELH